jgi:hypothetical protein
MDHRRKEVPGSVIWIISLACSILAILSVLIFLLHPGNGGVDAWSSRPEFAYLDNILWFLAGVLLCLISGIGLLVGLVLLAMKRVRAGRPALLALALNVCAAGMLIYALKIFERIANP